MSAASSGSGTFILSLDCEGRWGAADRGIGPRDAMITDDSLAWAYRTLFELLERYEIPATFAVVGLFALGADGGRAVEERLRESPAHRRWLDAAGRRMAAGGRSGWYLPDLSDRVIGSGMHELASHSACHLPLDGDDVDAGTVRADLDAVRLSADLLGHEMRTLVFPRNRIRGLEALAPAGYLGYREALRGSPASPRARVQRLAGELDVRRTSQPHPAISGGVVPIPRGEVLNWRAGARRAIPPRITAARWRSVVEDATRTGGVAHLWLHPHNLITGHRMMSLLDGALATVADGVRRGNLRTLTQQDYCEAVLDPCSP